MKEIIVVGAGASGLAAAIAAARHGASVTVLEQDSKPARKLLRTGNGHCNLTNLGSPHGRYSSPFGEKVLEACPVSETLGFFRSVGVAVRSRDDLVYPYNEEAQTVVRALLRECERIGVHLHTNVSVESIRCSGRRFLVHTSGSWNYESDAVILSCGTPAGFPVKTGSAVHLAERLGHTSVPLLPGLVGLRTGRRDLLKCAGTRARIRATLYVDGKPVDSEKGQIQFTAKGISGICIMNLSTRAVRELERGSSVEIGLDFLDEDRSVCAPETVSSILPEKLKGVVLGGISGMSGGIEAIGTKEPHAKESGTKEPHAKEAGMKENGMKEILKRLTDFRLPVTGALSMSEAQTASGGIRTDEVFTDSLESKKVPGLYLTGEMLDVTGKCGGWNLQFAWSTGILAGTAASSAVECTERF